MARQDNSLVLSLPGEPSSVPAARRAVAGQLRAWGLDPMVEPVSLAVSELATNAVLHAGGGLRVTLSRVSEGVRLEVGDGSARTPQQRRPTELSGTGRGLHLVNMLAADWGVESASGTGKVVWAVFAVADHNHADPGRCTGR